MAERPILFSGEMVRAILAGRKTQTRLVVKPQPELMQPGGTIKPHPFDVGMFLVENWDKQDRAFPNVWRCENIRSPYAPGDTLWVRETWAPFGDQAAIYCATNIGLPVDRWRPSIHMPRWASRITLRVTGVRVERLREISTDDALSEGVAETKFYDEGERMASAGAPRSAEYLAFAYRWQSINGPESWAANPWVWVVELEKEGANG